MVAEFSRFVNALLPLRNKPEHLGEGDALRYQASLV